MPRSQRDIWREDHIKQKKFTRIHSDKPSGPVRNFADFLKEKGYLPGRTEILDIGCGKGRNSIWLASQGYSVVGVDFAQEAIEEAEVRSIGRFKNLKFEVLDLTGKWPYDAGSFQAIIDCNSTICIPSPGRQSAIAEAHRALEQGGYYLFYGVARTPFVDKPPGPEPNSTIFSRTGKFEKQYTEEELRNAYGDFLLVKLDTKTGSDLIEGKEISYSMWVGVFQKS